MLDEDGCKKIIFSEAYSNIVPPTNINSGGGDERLKIHLSARLANLLDIDEKRSMVTMKIELSASWRDSRLKYQTLSNTRTKNLLAIDEINKVILSYHRRNKILKLLAQL